MPMNPHLTVIICTYNRAFILGECLESLAGQTAPADTFTVLVIDNNSTDDTQAVAKDFVNRLPGLRVVIEPEQGLSLARNRGMAEAQTDWVAFLDDDAKASPGWVHSILKTVAAGDFDCFGGPYYAWHRFGPPPAWLEEDFGTYRGPGKYGPLGEFHIPGGNCAFKKSLAQAAGGFPVDIGMKGAKCAYGEETLLFSIMQQDGARLGFVPEMRIEHCVLPYKYGLRWRLCSAYAIERDHCSAFPCSTTSHFLRFGKIFLWYFPRKIILCFQKKLPWQRIALECACPIFAFCGAVYGMIKRKRTVIK